MSHHSPCDLPNVESTSSFWHREPSSLLKGHRTTRSLPEKADVVIIGSGLTGASIAHHIFNQDHVPGTNSWRPEIVMLEAREACWGATGRNGGHCQPLLFQRVHDPSVARFELKNFLAIQQLVDDRKIDCEFITQPGIRGVYGAEAVERIENALSILRETAPDLEAHMRLTRSADELKQYRLAGAEAVLITDVAARLWPYKLVARILEDLLRDTNLRGHFNLQTLTPALQVQRTEAGWIVSTARGTIEAGYVVLATNAYTSHLLPAFADLIVPCRGQMSALQPPDWLAGRNRLRTSIGFEGRVMDRYLIQRSSDSGEQLMLGGGRLLNRSLGISDDSVIDEKVAAYLRCTLPQSIDHATHDYGLELEAENEWTGIMGWSRDGLPWIGPASTHDGLYIAAGFTGHGMPNCWLSGKAVATMMLETSHGASQQDAVAAARRLTSLPAAYILHQGRIREAQKLDIRALHEPLNADVDPYLHP